MAKRSDDHLRPAYLVEQQALIKKLKIRVAPVPDRFMDRADNVTYKHLQFWQTNTLLAIQLIKRGKSELAEKNLMGMLPSIVKTLNDALAHKKAMAKYHRDFPTKAAQLKKAMRDLRRAMAKRDSAADAETIRTIVRKARRAVKAA